MAAAALMSATAVVGYLLFVRKPKKSRGDIPRLQMLSWVRFSSCVIRPPISKYFQAVRGVSVEYFIYLEPTRYVIYKFMMVTKYRFNHFPSYPAFFGADDGSAKSTVI